MPIRYLLPLTLAWARTKSMLFRPFKLGTWVVLGFAAWISGFIDPSSGMTEFSKAMFDPSNRDSSASLFETLTIISVLVGVLIFAMLVAVVLLWVSSRGKFVFLHNVIHERAEISAPWKQYARLGDSLFLWRLAFYALASLTLLVIMVVMAMVAGGGSIGNDLVEMMAGISLVLLVGVLVILAIPFYCVSLALNDFVVPIMAKHGATATEAWGIFLPLLKDRLANFVVYLLFLAAGRILLALATGILTVATCCIGGLILAIPVVGTMVLLPVHATYRAYSVEFLAQFGPQYAIDGVSFR